MCLEVSCLLFDVPSDISTHELTLRMSRMRVKDFSENMAMSGVLSMTNVVVAALSGVGYRAVTAVSKAA